MSTLLNKSFTLKQIEMKVFVVAVVAVLGMAAATPIHLYNPFDKKDYCAAVEFTEPWQCAVLFDDNKCKGWELPISEGYTELSWGKKNDAESVVVREGCVFTGNYSILVVE